MGEQPTTDRLVIQHKNDARTTAVAIQHKNDGGRWFVRWFVSRARLRKPDEGLTQNGETLLALFTGVEGIRVEASNIGAFGGGYSTSVYLVHPALWNWDEVEPAVIDAYRQLLGVDRIDVIRETPGGNGN